MEALLSRSRGLVVLLALALVRGDARGFVPHPSCAPAFATATERLLELSERLYDDAAAAELVGSSARADSFRARVEGVRAACTAEFEQACTATQRAINRGVSCPRIPILAKWAASRQLDEQVAAALEPALDAQLGVLADAAADEFEARQIRVVPGTEVYAAELLRARRDVQRDFESRARGCVPRGLRKPPLRRVLREASARVDAQLGEQAERLVRISPPMVPPADTAAEKWYRRLAWQLLAILLNLAQAQAQDWWARRAQRRAAAAAALAAGDNSSGGDGKRGGAGGPIALRDGPAF